MKKFLLSILCSTLVALVVAQNNPKLYVKKCSSPPKIDGLVDSNDPWTVSWIPIDKSPNINVTSEMTAKFQITYDDNNLYVVARVYDSEIDTASLTTHWNDCVEVFVKLDTTSGETGSYITGDYQLRMRRGSVFPNRFDAGQLSYFDWKNTNLNIKQVDEGDSYTQEWQLPWVALDSSVHSAFEKQYIKFEIMATDNTKEYGRSQITFWNSNSDEQWHNTKYFGLVQLGLPLVYIEGGKDKTVVCGESAQISVITNFENPGTISYSWTPSEGLSQDNISNPIVNTKTDKIYFLTVSTSNGEIVHDSLKIKVVPLAASANNLSITCGNTAQLNVSTNYKGTEPLIYYWQPSTGLSATDIKNPIATISKSTNYSVQVSTSNGCVSQNNINVNVSMTNYQPSICMVTVNENHKNLVVWQKPDNDAIDSFVIYRESTYQTNVFDLIGKVANSEQSVFVDENSNSLIQGNRYKITARDICGFETPQSASHKTMHLTINRGQGNSWNLIWDAYEGFNVSSYKIYRGSSQTALEQVGSTAGGFNTFTDFTAPEGDIFYQVEVLAPYSCNTLKSTTYSSSRSNIASNTAISVPSAFTINSPGIYPVPVKDDLSFKINFNEPADAYIYASDGRLVLALKQITLKQKIDVRKLSRGMYLLHLNNCKGNYFGKFIKE
jgi:hypothetical protein